MDLHDSLAILLPSSSRLGVDLLDPNETEIGMEWVET